MRFLTIASGLLLLAGPALAETGDTATILRRPSDALGMPGLSIDLSTRASARYALVIGNGEYEHAPDLSNAIADARLVAKVLRQSGYIVQEYENLTRRGFEGAMRRLISDTGKGSEVLIYYAGHGVQVGNSNRLLPVDANLTTVYDLPFESVSLSSMLSIAGARSRSLVVILDSCRNNPFPDSGMIVGLEGIPQALRTGFAAQQSPVNSLIVFSTSPDAVALDGTNGNSPFTLALAEVASESPDAPMDDVLKEVRRRVYQTTQGLQVPWESSSLVETIRFDSDPDTPGFEYADAADATGAPAVDGELTLTLPLERRIDVGAALREHSPEMAMMVTRTPQNGRLELQVDQQTRGLTLLTPVAEGVASLVYANNQPEVSATTMDKPQLADSFEVESGGQVQKVQLTLNVDPCDFEAGDHLDPEGVGVARYPNEIDLPKALAACTDAVQREPDNGRFHYELGRIHLGMRDLDMAEREFTAARDLGHTRAWHALGMLEVAREAETGGAQRIEASQKALALLAMGVDAGDPYAFHSLGLRLLETGESQELRRQGFDLLMRSLEVGHTFSMNALGFYFLDEKSDHYEPERGLRYLKESADRGDIYGFENLGQVALFGLGGTKANPEEALDWLKKAADGGHPTAPTSIGRMYFNGALGRPDFGKSVMWYDIGLARGDAWGGANAAWVIANRQPDGYSLGDAAARAAKSAVMDNADATTAAMDVLNRMGARGMNAGAQVLMNELGAAVTADGAFGPASDEALAAIAARYGASFPADPADRLLALARLFWKENPFRVDLF